MSVKAVVVDATVPTGAQLPELSCRAIAKPVAFVLFAGITRLRRTGIGRALIAVRDNEKRAAACGIKPAFVKLLGFAMSPENIAKMTGDGWLFS